MTSTEINLGNVVLLPPDALEPMQSQPRSEFDETFIQDELAPNILQMKAEGLGIAGTGIDEPIKATIPLGALDENGRLRPGIKLPIYSGESRWRSANYLNQTQPDSIPLVPVIISDLAPDRAFEMAYFANAHRRDVTAYDEGRALLRIKRARNIADNRKLARFVHKSYEHVRNHLAAVGDEDVAEILIDRPEAVLHARRIAAVKDESLRERLIKQAKNGATQADISDAISAAKLGISVKKLRAQRQADKYEKANEKFTESTQPSAWKPSDDTKQQTAPAESQPLPKDWNFLERSFQSMLKQSYEIEAALKSDDFPDEIRHDLRDYTNELNQVIATITASLMMEPPNQS